MTQNYTGKRTRESLEFFRRIMPKRMEAMFYINDYKNSGDLCSCLFTLVVIPVIFISILHKINVCKSYDIVDEVFENSTRR